MRRPTGDERNAAEIEYWNGPGGERWLNRQQAQDALLAPVADVLLDRAAAHPGEIVLDIGCGCGSTSIALAQRVAPGGRSEERRVGKECGGGRVAGGWREGDYVGGSGTT